MLLIGIASGDRQAFEALYHQMASLLFGICLRVLSDRAEAEDVLQEIFTTIWQKAAQFDAGRASAVSWLAMIARNRAIDRLRSMSPRGRMMSIDLVDETEDLQRQPTEEAETDRGRLEGCLGELDARRRTLIRAAFFSGLTYEELARSTGAPLGSVKSWIRRGLRQLRACLER